MNNPKENNMELTAARQIIDTLAQGIHPVTGDVMPEDSPYNAPPIIRAMFAVTQALDEPMRIAEKMCAVKWFEVSEILTYFDSEHELGAEFYGTQRVWLALLDGRVVAGRAWVRRDEGVVSWTFDHGDETLPYDSRCEEPEPSVVKWALIDAPKHPRSPQ
jgi:hypothetical protein